MMLKNEKYYHMKMNNIKTSEKTRKLVFSSKKTDEVRKERKEKIGINPGKSRFTHRTLSQYMIRTRKDRIAKTELKNNHQ
jgi:hypothetical protein